MNTKTLIAVAAALLAPLQVCAAAPPHDGRWLVVSLRDGHTEAHPFGGLPVITIDGTLFTARGGTDTVSYAATDIDSFRLADSREGGVETTEAADVNGDGTVDVADISAVISVMAGSHGGSGSTATTGTADVNADGTVDVADIAAVITAMASAQ